MPNAISEIKLVKKKEIAKGIGMLQNVYDIVSRPNMVAKTPKHGQYTKYETKMYEVAKNNPELFAEIYILKPNFVVMEKLDTTKAIETYNQIKETIDFYIDQPIGRTIVKYCKYREKIFDMAPDLKEALELEELMDHFIEMASLVCNAKNALNGEYPDFHQHNIGYDKEGRLKFLDW